MPCNGINSLHLNITATAWYFECVFLKKTLADIINFSSFHSLIFFLTKRSSFFWFTLFQYEIAKSKLNIQRKRYNLIFLVMSLENTRYTDAKQLISDYSRVSFPCLIFIIQMKRIIYKDSFDNCKYICTYFAFTLFSKHF